MSKWVSNLKIIKPNTITSPDDEKHMPIPEISSPPVHDNAYTWLLMKGDAYLPGIYISVYSVLRTNPDADLVVMVTGDVSEKSQDILLKVATHIFHISYLSFKTNTLKTAKQNRMYKDWKSVAYTKWNMLALPYKKAVLLDGDTMALANLDQLFNLPTPAAPFNNPFVKPLGFIPDYLTGQRGKDKYLVHGAVVKPKDVINICNKNGMLLTASAVVLSPALKDYEDYITMVKSQEPYGKTTCHSMVDEQSIALFYAKRKGVNWYNVHHRYNLIGWKNKFLLPNDIPLVLHYFSENKPWNMKYNEWDDIISWYKMSDEAVKQTGITPQTIMLKPENVSKSILVADTFIKKFTKNPKIKSVLDVYDAIESG
jgi:lipopolysaccharide biosynthesis glycosyltransferase